MEEQRQKSDSLRQELRKSDKAKREVCFFNIVLALSLLKTLPSNVLSSWN